MASSTLEHVPPGALIFVDASIFIYHFSGASAECRTFLERCERGELKGVTSTVAMAEAAHRLMMLEAVSTGQVSAGNVVKKLRKKPQVVQTLHLYQEQVEKIPLMRIEIEGTTRGLGRPARDCRSRSSHLHARGQYGLSRSHASRSASGFPF